MTDAQRVRDTGTPSTNPAEIRKRPQQTVRLSASCTMVTGSGPLFRHVDPDRFMWSGDGERAVSVFIPFDRPLSATPHVQIGLAGIDASKAQNLRLSLAVTQANRDGFVATARTWDDTKIAGIDVTWTAVAQTAEARVAHLTGARRN